MLPREHYLKQAFQDLAHFPSGFEKGGLSDIQARLVRKNGTLISALCIDEVSDPTSEDLHILKVIANQSSPKNPVEQAWIKYLSLVKNLAASNPKGKGKSKSAKAEAVAMPEPAKPVEKAEKPAPAAEKKIEKAAAVSKTTATKKAEPAPVEAKAKSTTKAEPKAPVKAAAKAVVVPKAETKKAEAKKPEPKKAELKKPEPKKPEPKAAAKKVETKKADAKKPTKAK